MCSTIILIKWISLSCRMFFHSYLCVSMRLMFIFILFWACINQYYLYPKCCRLERYTLFIIHGLLQYSLRIPAKITKKNLKAARSKINSDKNLNCETRAKPSRDTRVLRNTLWKILFIIKNPSLSCTISLCIFNSINFDQDRCKNFMLSYF